MGVSGGPRPKTASKAAPLSTGICAYFTFQRDWLAILKGPMATRSRAKFEMARPLP